MLARLVTLSRVYGTLLAALLFIRFVLGDFAWWAFALNAMLVYAFLPALAVLGVALLTRRRDMWAVFAASLIIWLLMWGRLFLPRLPAAQAGGPTFTVMSHNILGYNFNTQATVRVIRESNADVIALQELNPENAEAIERELGDEYPYRWLDPQPSVVGGGLISRLPFERLDAGPLDQIAWVSIPMAVRLDVQGRAVTLVRFHAFAGPGSVHARQWQAQLLAEYARSHSGPLVFVGDLNATDQNVAYDLIARTMRDAWREAGWGLGNTFPGEPTAEVGGSRPLVAGIPVPMWLVRIDFVFHSADLKTLEARLGPYDGASDHRPVIATLGFNHQP
jgi:vancomycin resistance protein VanJ